MNFDLILVAVLCLCIFLLCDLWKWKFCDLWTKLKLLHRRNFEDLCVTTQHLNLTWCYYKFQYAPDYIVRSLTPSYYNSHIFYKIYLTPSYTNLTYSTNLTSYYTNLTSYYTNLTYSTNLTSYYTNPTFYKSPLSHIIYMPHLFLASRFPPFFRAFATGTPSLWSDHK